MALSRDEYQRRALENAFGDHGEDWDPDRGFGANRARIVKVYDYYRDTYNRNSDVFLWAGLGRMAGGAVVSGLDMLVSLLPDPNPITRKMVEIGKSIFEDLAWLHEAVLDDPGGAIDLAREHDAGVSARRSYGDALTDMLAGDVQRVAAGNQALLENEQGSIIQPRYDELRNSREVDTAFLFARTRTATANIHPYHRDFLNSFPTTLTKDVIRFDDRWEWINLAGGMWEKWVGDFLGPGVGVTADERARLVNLPFDRILRRDWAPIDSSLEPPGSQ